MAEKIQCRGYLAINKPMENHKKADELLKPMKIERTSTNEKSPYVFVGTSRRQVLVNLDVAMFVLRKVGIVSTITSISGPRLSTSISAFWERYKKI